MSRTSERAVRARTLWLRHNEDFGGFAFMIVFFAIGMFYGIMIMYQP